MVVDRRPLVDPAGHGSIFAGARMQTANAIGSHLLLLGVDSTDHVVIEVGDAR